MIKTYVYKITRIDNLEYIGITVNCKKRFSDHSRSERFAMGIKKIEILKECDSYDEAEDLEEYYISLYGTFNSGLNLSLNGKGNHLCSSFTTKGLKFSDESKLKMSLSAKKRIIRDGPPKIKVTEELRKKWSDQRKGICWGPKKITDDQFKEMIHAYNNDLIQFDESFIRKLVKKSQQQMLRQLRFSELKSPNGKQLTKLAVYSHYFSQKFNVTPGCISAILDKQKRAKSYE